VYGLSSLDAIISVTRSDITSYFSPLYVYWRDKYIVPDVNDFQSTWDDCFLVACSIYRQNSGNEESTSTGSSFSSAPTIVGTPKAWILPTRHQMPYSMKGFTDSEGSIKKTVR